MKLAEILMDLYKNINWNKIIFKWWTSMMFFLGLDRMSVDLDFEIGSLEYESEVFDKVTQILQKHWKIKKSYNKINTLFWFLSYGWPRNIKIEISKRNILKDKLTSNIYNFYWVKIPVLDWSIQASFKVVAILLRDAGRDLYDLNFYLKKWILFDNDYVQMIYKGLTGKLLSLDDIIKKALDKIKKVDSNTILAGWWDLLDDKQKHYVKSQLKNELLMRLENLVDL